MFLMNLRDRSTLFWGFAFPIGLILLYGAIWGGATMGGVSAITWLMIGVVVLNIMASGMIGDSTWFASARDKGQLQRLHATPLPPLQLIGSYVLVRVLIGLIQAALICTVAMLVYGATMSLSGLALGFGLAVLGLVVFIILGQAVGAAAPSVRSAMAVGQVIYFPLMFLSNLFLPLEALPGWLANVSQWTPATMLVDLLRTALIPQMVATQAAWVNLLGLGLYGLLGLLVAVRFFRWSPR
jgi:ABC-2 type transport system permease protein